MPVQADSRAGLPALFFLSMAVALAVLLIEWFVVAGFGLQLKQGEVARVLQLLVLAALVTGAGGWLLAIVSGRWLDSVAVAVAAPVAVLLLVDLFFALGYSPVARFLGAGAFAVVVFLALLQLIQKGPAWLCSAAATGCAGSSDDCTACRGWNGYLAGCRCGGCGDSAAYTGMACRQCVVANVIGGNAACGHRCAGSTHPGLAAGQ